jgi:hypothetical protein
VTSARPHPPFQRPRGDRAAAPGRSWAKLLEPVLGLTVVGTVIAIAALGLLALAAAVVFTAWLGMSGSNK